MSDRETKVLGFIAAAPGGADVLCDGDSCVVMGSEKSIKQYVEMSDPSSSSTGYRISKARYGHVLKAMKMGGAYSFDREAFSRFCPLAREDGIDVVDFASKEQGRQEDDIGIPLMRVQWIPKE